MSEGRGVRRQKQTAIRLAREGVEGALDVTVVLDGGGHELKRQRGCGGLSIAHKVAVNGTPGIGHQSNAAEGWRYLLEKGQPLADDALLILQQSSEITVWPRQSADPWSPAGANRISIWRLLPSDHPSRSSSRRSFASRDSVSRSSSRRPISTPIRRIRSGCCACATSGQAAAPARSNVKSRRLMSASRLGQCIVPAQTCVGEGPVDVRFGSEADMCGALRHVRFAPDFDRKSRHRLITRMVLWSAKRSSTMQAEAIL